MSNNQKITGSLSLVGNISGRIRSPSHLDGNIVKPEIERIPTGLHIKKLTATVSSDTTGTITMLTDDSLKEARNDPRGFVIMRYLGASASTAQLNFWFTANFSIDYSGSTAHNSLVLRSTASGVNANFNTNGLPGDNYNGHINITSSGGLLLMNNATYPLKAGNYEILVGLWE